MAARLGSVGRRQLSVRPRSRRQLLDAADARRALRLQDREDRSGPLQGLRREQHAHPASGRRRARRRSGRAARASVLHRRDGHARRPPRPHHRISHGEPLHRERAAAAARRLRDDDADCRDRPSLGDQCRDAADGGPLGPHPGRDAHLQHRSRSLRRVDSRRFRAAAARRARLRVARCAERADRGRLRPRAYAVRSPFTVESRAVPPDEFMFELALPDQPDSNVIVANTVRMYTCRLTTYARGHIGNFRTFICLDVLRRTLKYLGGYRVRQVMNFTDVDDRTIAGAQKAGMDLRTYTEQYITAFREDARALGLEDVEETPRATDTANLRAMADMIAALDKNGHTYRSDGSIYFKISTVPDYVKLVHLDHVGIKPVARVDSS